MKEDFEQAPAYGQLITTTTTEITNVFRIRLYEPEQYNFHTQLIHSRDLYYRTDQDEALGANDRGEPLNKFDKVWFNGVLIYSRPWWKRIFK